MSTEPFVVAESTLTDKYQVTVPAPIRKALGLGKRDKIEYRLKIDGTVELSRVEESPEDPVVESFLAFLSKDVETHPENVKPIPLALIEKARKLTEGMDTDLNAPLLDDEEEE